MCNEVQLVLKTGRVVMSKAYCTRFRARRVAKEIARELGLEVVEKIDKHGC